VDSIDLYLLHWRGSVPLAETLEAFEKLAKRGDILSYGVSNFDTPDLEEAWALPFGSGIACNQILYNLKRRAVEYDLLPWCREHHVPVIAYSPVEQGRLLKDRKLREIAERHAATPSQLAIAWLLAQPEIIAVPKSAFLKHVEENRAAAEIELSADDLARIDAIFPRPKARKPLEML
jgi:diketogulonate reductase-like aldo/keto reductase